MSGTPSPAGSRVPSTARPPPSPLRSASSSGPIAASSSSNVAQLGSAPAATSKRPPIASSTPPPGGKARARDLLRKHYGLGVGAPPPRTGNPADPMDLNSPAFDAKSYYEQLITTSSLPALLKRENEFITEIRQLDSERQSLVYNHHHELIAASDTIAAMKTRAESLDGDLDLLRAAFSEISRLCAEVSFENNAASDSGETKNSSDVVPAT
ncbi:uncharacterized protein LACBIDRAFT_297173 [Laccaria bicolor S238N-H82]|uniref:Vacuolar protein sorting-associated protein 51 homolog n=1 Tax=Laccaria bicolor (strain S238N-H82 / ATCC MYA-4686) TaxID=486041 RepID=B0DA63_LACBS|nr:uncharacterized protein LACBIDRAFT_297173 [Laccaria bicolor S238N-H82]EDR08468.1 predicted protein [Laccaria bicolor S238N-H82]|eukprot:XP_001880693.1 predicted protein [Laccaria bicolor S238N-H82]